MKGLLLSLVVFAAYVPLAALLAHLLQIKRHGRLFFPMMAWSAPVYLLLFAVLPRDLGFLPPALVATHAWVDAVAGLVALLLNIHSFIDYFFAFNGGFSTSLMLLLRNQPRTTHELVDAYRGPDGLDKIYAWRLPFLVAKGYITLDETSRTCRLTPHGRRIAGIGIAIKRLLNLSRGG